MKAEKIDSHEDGDEDGMKSEKIDPLNRLIIHENKHKRAYNLCEQTYHLMIFTFADARSMERNYKIRQWTIFT
jgi:hypothetical protein